VNPVVVLISALAGLVSAIGILLSGLGTFLPSWTRNRKNRWAGAGGRNGLPPGLSSVVRRRVGASAWVSVYSGLAAWAFSLVVVILMAGTAVSMTRMPLVMLIACVAGLAFFALFFGVLALGEAVSYAERGIAMRAGSGLLAAVGAVAAMLIASGTGPII
jgi:hypothetical protein